MPKKRYGIFPTCFGSERIAERLRAIATPDVSDDDERLRWMGLRSIASSVFRRWQNLGIFFTVFDSRSFFSVLIHQHLQYPTHLFVFMRLHEVHVRGLFRQYADLDDSESPLDGVGDEQVLLRPHLFVLK